MTRSTPESILLDRLDQQLVQQALDRLPVQYREILLLCEVEEMSYQEISSTLAIPIGTVMSRLSRARRALRNAVQEKRKGAEAWRANSGLKNSTPIWTGRCRPTRSGCCASICVAVPHARQIASTEYSQACDPIRGSAFRSGCRLPRPYSEESRVKTSAVQVAMAARPGHVRRAVNRRGSVSWSWPQP